MRDRVIALIGLVAIAGACGGSQRANVDGSSAQQNFITGPCDIAGG